jgi:7-cyano-7-deazaguanine synthase
MKKAICLLSGGLDSSVTGYIAKSIGYEIYALSFLYGQRHNKEIKSAKEIAKGLGVKKHVIFNIEIHKFGGSSLIDKSIQPKLDQDFEDIGKTIPTTYVPARNTIFLSVALGFAETFDADAIFIGATSTDYSGYPDCRPEYFKAFQKMADLATKKCVERRSIEIVTPVLHMNKYEIIKKGYELEVPFEKTWSCYLGKDKSCGCCESCLLRLRGFKENGLKDPLEYENYPNWY